MNPARIPRMFRDDRRLLHLGGGVQDLGRTIVSDPHVCGGVPVFKGTRITVWDVMAQVLALDHPPDAIVQATGGAVTREAIEEAKQLMRNSPETADEDLLICASSEFYEGPEHFTSRRASAHVPAPIDRSWLKRLLELEPPKRGLGRLLAVDPDIDPYMPVIRGTRIPLEEVVDWITDPSDQKARTCLVLLEKAQQSAAGRHNLARRRLVVAGNEFRRARFSSERRAGFPGVIEDLHRPVGELFPDAVDALKSDPHDVFSSIYPVRYPRLRSWLLPLRFRWSRLSCHPGEIPGARQHQPSPPL